MDIQELLKQNTSTDGITDFAAVQKEIDFTINNSIEKSVNQQVTEYKDKMQELESKNEELSTLNKNLSTNDEFLKTKIRDLTSENDTFKSQKALNDFKERANKIGVAQEVQEQFINAGADLNSVNLTPFQTIDPNQGGEQNSSSQGGSTSTQAPEDSLFDFMNEDNNDNGGNE